MKLVNYGPGELSDRLTILALKILIGSETGKDVTHFQTEQTTLLQQVRSRTLNGIWFPVVLELAAVNAALWHAEDELRAWRACAGGGYGKAVDQIATQDRALLCAFRIQALNDKRAQLVQQINKDAGEAGGQEKL